MELYGNRQTLTTGSGRKSLIIQQLRSFTASLATRCRSKGPRNFTSIRSGIRSCSGKRLRCGAGWQESPQAKLGVDQLRSVFCLFFVDDDRDLNLRGGYQLNVDPISPQAFEHPRRDTRMRPHSNSDDAQLGYATGSVQAYCAHLAYYRHQDLTGVFQFILVNGE